jgi:dihydroneopterin aldolase
MNAIFIHDLRLTTRIGVYAWERALPQTIRLDLDLELASDRAFTTGELADALDYAVVVERVRAFVNANPYPLVERFAEALAAMLLDEFGVAGVRLRVAKLGALPGVREIGVAIERRRTQPSPAG